MKKGSSLMPLIAVILVWEGVNVVIWSFMSIHKEEFDGLVVSKSGSLDFDCDREMIRRL
jgi:hypothetical protein